jgi:hypothetical protein
MLSGKKQAGKVSNPLPTSVPLAGILIFLIFKKYE